MKYHERIGEVATKLRPYVRNTPLLESTYLSRLCGAQVFLKCEVLQHTNAFKVRGAVNKVLSLPAHEKLVVTASGGNHGLALAYAAKHTGRHAVVFVPKTTPEYKIAKIRELGGKVIVRGDVWDDSDKFAQDYSRTHKAVYVHPFSDDVVIDGQATIAHEILQTRPDIEVIITSIGGGGLISGVAQYAKSFRSSINVYGVETEGADSMYQSIKAGHVVTLPTITSMAESLAAKQVTQKTFDIVKRSVDDLFTVSDAQATRAQLELLQQEKLLTEPAASCSVAATKYIPNLEGKKLAIVLCGGNLPLERLGEELCG